MKTVAVIDDHHLISEAIRSLLQNQKEITFWNGFTSITSFVEKVNTEKVVPDWLLLDINLNGEDGLAGCEQLIKSYPTLKILMLTSLTQPSLVMEAFKRGAKGFLLKNISKDELLKAFRMVEEGQHYIHPEISFTAPSTQPSRFESIPKLSRREKEVLALIMEEKTTQEIAEILCVTVSTVETHRAGLFSKTGVKNVVGLIKFTIQNGLLE